MTPGERARTVAAFLALAAATAGACMAMDWLVRWLWPLG